MKPPIGQRSGQMGAPGGARTGLGGADQLADTRINEVGLDQERELQRVEAALKRLDHGRFGHCLYCGDQIGLGRLRHDPAVESCDTCQES